MALTLKPIAEDLKAEQERQARRAKAAERAASSPQGGKREAKPHRIRAKLLLDIDKVNDAVKDARGLVGFAAEVLGVSRGALREFISSHTECAKVLKEAREQMGDVAENKLFEQVDAGELKAITYYLSTVHKDRGYGLGKGQSLYGGDTNQVFIESVNIVSVPTGRFLTAPDGPVIEGEVNLTQSEDGEAA